MGTQFLELSGPKKEATGPLVGVPESLSDRISQIYWPVLL